MRIALVQDWFVVNGGAEKVVKEIVDLFPSIEIFSLVDFLNDNDRKDILKGKKATTSFLQHLPFAKNNYRNYLPLFPTAIESLDFSGFDLIISSSYAVAKGIKKNKNQHHICYCHSPVRYAWDLEDEYVSTLSLPVKIAARKVLAYIRKWDLSTTGRVDQFVANSKNVSERISRIYKRESIIIYPPVDTSVFKPEEKKDDYYFTTLRMVPYKKADLIIKAFNNLPGKRLIISGDGPMLKSLKASANKNIEFTGFVEIKELVRLMQKAKAFILAAEEDFGITSLEAQSCCTPVIALRKGGYLETVVEGKTGIFFNEQTVSSLNDAILKFEEGNYKFNKDDYAINVSKFSVEKFRACFNSLILNYAGRKNTRA
jgi:glycosyltransferase involved in cell wall biosynthesis